MSGKTNSEPALTDRMKLCCHWYALTANAAQAACLCFSRMEQQQRALQMLSSPAAGAYLAKIRSCAPCKHEPDVREGYRRLAFGSISDAVKLMFAPEENQPEIDSLDLFSVSELRRGKGTLEISFFDRLDALDRLAREEAENSAKDGLGFYQAIQEGAAALGGEQ